MIKASGLRKHILSQMLFLFGAVGGLPFYASCSVFFGGNSHFGAVFRQQVFYQFRPLQEAEVTTVEIIFVAHVVHLIEFLDAVEIEVVDR